MRARVLRSALLPLALAAAAPGAAAQAVLGVGEDALPAPGGAVRVGVGAEWAQFDERYVRDGSGGWTTAPAGAGLSAPSLGPTQIPALGPLQTTLRTLSGVSGLNVTLGALATSVTNQIQTTPIVAEIGVTRRLSIGVTVPIVRTRAGVSFNANVGGNQANVAFLNDLAARSADTAFANQLARAGAAAQTYCAGAGAGSAECAGGVTLGASAAAFGAGLAQVYGDTANLVPVQRGALQNAIDARAAAFRSSLNAIAAVAGSGVPQVTAEGVTGAQSPLLTADLQRVLTDPRFGIESDTLGSVERTHLGDAELAAKFLLLDTFGGDARRRGSPRGLNMRAAVGAAFRAPTGAVAQAGNFAEVATGTHEGAVSARGYFDLLAGDHFWASVIARSTHSLGSDVDVRVTDAPDQILPGAYRNAHVHREIGNLFELEVTPRWVVNDLMSVGAQYSFRRQGETRYTGAAFTAGPSAATGGTTIAIDPATLGAETASREQRLGAGVSFSNLKAFNEGSGRIPFEVSFLHTQTVAARGVNVPKLFVEQVRMRVYYRLFGR